mgnify:CR=1 FL=1
MTLLILFQALLHPFHVSVSEVKYKEDQKVLQITSRIFLDDLELALRNYSGDELLNITEETSWEQVNENLSRYTVENLKIWDEKGNLMQLNYSGAEIEEYVMYCYLEIEKVKKLKQYKIQNSLLHEVWDDQENIIHFRAFGDVKSERLFKDENVKEFDWE